MTLLATRIFDCLKARTSTRLILVGLVLLMGISLQSLWQGFSLIGKTFPGFSLEFSFITFPVDSQDWTGSKADFQYYEQIKQVDGKTFGDIEEFKRYIQSLPPQTPVNYTVMRAGKPVQLTIPTMIFSMTDYLKIFGINIFLAWLYAGLTAFILLRRERISQSRILLFLTFSFSAVYAMRAGYDYLHQYISLALIAYCAFPLSLFLLGSDLARSQAKKSWLKVADKLNLALGGLLAITLAVLSQLLTGAPYQHAGEFKLFVQLYELLVNYYLINILAFMGLVLWRSFQKKQDELKNWQARVILFGSLFSFLPYVVMMGAFWVFKLPWALPSELIAANTYLFILFASYAVLHDEGVALEVFVKKTSFYYLMLFVFGMVYTVSYRLSTILMQASFLEQSKELITFSSGLVAFILVSNFNQRIQELITNIFYRQRKSLNQSLEAFIQESTTTLEPQKLLQLGISFLESAFAPQNLALYLSANLESYSPDHLLRYYAGPELFPEKLSLNNRLTSPLELEQFKAANQLHKELVLPLHKGESLLGLLILDKKASGLGYFSEDRELLQKFAFYFSSGFYITCLSHKALLAYQKTEAAKRMEVLGTLASGVAHDFNNLLSTIVMSVSLLKYMNQDDQISERLETIQLSAEKGAAITKALRDYASVLPPDQAVPISAILRELKERLSGLIPAGVRLELSEPEEPLIVLADTEQLLRALLELVHNALQAMNGQGLLRIELRTDPASSEPFEVAFAEQLPNAVQIRISDSGEGMAPEIQQQIFDPFFSAWSENQGLGLGLSIAKQIIKNHNGQLEVSSQPEQGSCFVLSLPLATEGNLTRPQPLYPAQSPKISKILLIEDQSELRYLLAEALTKQGYQVIQAANGQEGLALFEAHLNQPLLVICDLDMPLMSGREFIAAARKLVPHQQIVVSSGNLDPAEAKAMRQNGLHILAKPYSLEQLIDCLQQPQIRQS